MFTGDRSGEWLYRALHRAGIASQPVSRDRQDDLALDGAFVTAACRCAPPQNKPSPSELAACSSYLDRELALLAGSLRVVLALGRIAWDAAWSLALRHAPASVPRPRPSFAHGAETPIDLGLGHGVCLVGSYHPSQQNTLTGRLTRSMLDRVVVRASALAGDP
jgi:uracil-DNA glycosylase